MEENIQITPQERRLLLAAANGDAALLFLHLCGGGKPEDAPMPDRLIPDLMRGAAAGEEAVLRNPEAVRPWQHVFEPLSGYLLLGSRLLAGDRRVAGAWNFGPADNGSLPVREVVKIIQRFYPGVQYRIEADANAPHEAALLRLDWKRMILTP